MAALGYPEGPVDEEYVLRRAREVRNAFQLAGAELDFVLVTLTEKQAEELEQSLRKYKLVPIGRYTPPERFWKALRHLHGARLVCCFDGNIVVVALK